MQTVYNISNPTLKVLLIEDNPADRRLIQEMLSEVHQLGTAVSLTDSLDYLTHEHPDVILLDLYLPDSDRINTVQLIGAKAPDVAIVVITRFENEDLGLKSIRDGAQDYLVKGQFDSRTLHRAIRYALQRKQSEIALRQNEEQFRLMFEQSAVGMAYVNLDGRFQVVNDPLCEMLGYSQDELLTKTFTDITHPDDVAEDWANATRLLADEQSSYSMEKRYISKDGSTIWANLTGTLVRKDSGEPRYFLAVVDDITTRKKAEKAQLYLAAIVESSEDGIISKRLDGTITSWNAGAERIYGWSADEAIGQSISILFPPDYEAEYHHLFSKIRQGEPLSRFETRRVCKDGKQIDVALTISPIKDTAGNLIGASTIERDITTLKWAQAARQESEARLRQLTDNIDEVLWLRDVQTGQMLHISAAFATLWGVACERMYKQPDLFVQYTHPEDRDRILQAIQEHGDGNFNEEFRIVRPDGQLRWIRAHTLPIYDENGEVYRVAGIAEDITDYKRLVLAEQEQRALAEALRDIANALNSTVDIDEILNRLLTNIERVVQYDAAEIMLIENDRANIHRSRGYASRGLQNELEALEFVVAETPNLHYMYHSKKPLIIPDVEHTNGTHFFRESPALFWRSYAGVPISAKNEVIGFINLGSMTPHFFTPIHADRLQAFAEQAAIAIQNARLHEHSRELAAQHERQRLARDLHDAVSQTLFAATITAEVLLREWEQNPTSIGPKLSQLHKLTRGALAETRAVLLELRPESLADIDFDTLLEQLIEAIQSRKRLEISAHLALAEDPAPELKLVLYRITQEALNNIVKHAQASQVTIKLFQDTTQLVLEISDDGVGFEIASVQPTSMGLSIMQERADNANATLEIKSVVNKGTQITVIFPITTER